MDFPTSVEWRRTLTLTRESGADVPSGLSTKQGGMAALKTAAKTKAGADGLLDLTLDSLEDSKAVDIVPIDLAGKSPLADHMVICTGTSSRHVSTLADKLLETLKRNGKVVPRSEGLNQGDWALIDAGDIIVHIFRPEVREFYNLEEMWVSDTAASNQTLNS